MKIAEIVEQIKEANPKTLGKLTDAKAARIISAAFAEVGKHVDATTEGAVKIPALGAFAIKQVEREKEGQKLTVKKISFRAAKPKAKAEKVS
jgi:hypothetical protein